MNQIDQGLPAIYFISLHGVLQYCIKYLLRSLTDRLSEIPQACYLLSPLF
jgi:hypothetical protein